MHIINDKNVITRKSHRCFACQHKFEAGTQMHSQTLLGDDGIYTVYSCHSCETLISEFDFDDGDGCYPEGCTSEAFYAYGVKNAEDLLFKMRMEKTDENERIIGLSE